MHSGVERLFCPINCSVKIDLGFEIEFLLKCSFQTMFSKIYCLTKVDVLGTWERETVPSQTSDMGMRTASVLLH